MITKKELANYSEAEQARIQKQVDDMVAKGYARRMLGLLSGGHIYFDPDMAFNEQLMFDRKIDDYDETISDDRRLQLCREMERLLDEGYLLDDLSITESGLIEIREGAVPD
ncbi:MAG TPA: hypothetical protein V6C81_08160 [Planktothrix sp.]|jgi:hypothetical protein